MKKLILLLALVLFFCSPKNIIKDGVPEEVKEQTKGSEVKIETKTKVSFSKDKLEIILKDSSVNIISIDTVITIIDTALSKIDTAYYIDYIENNKYLN